MIRFYISLILFIGLVLPVAAAPPAFQVPIHCILGKDCFIQNYVDHDSGTSWKDYACGKLSYDGHQGTDFRLLDLAQMEHGVSVVAAAAGRVIGVRNQEPDLSVRVRGAEKIKGREAGNGVLIDHGDGWQTQYSHLRQNSVRVRMGQTVAAGEELGQVGLSGNTEFPHVDFTVRHQGRVIDPFIPQGGAHCVIASDTLWSRSVLDEVRYRPTGVLVAALYGDVPISTSAGPAIGADTPMPFSERAPRLAFYVEIFGIQAQDRVEFLLRDPQGQVLRHHQSTLPNPKAVWSASLVFEPSAKIWVPGQYSGLFRLFRGDKTEPLIERTVMSVKLNGKN